MSGRLAMAPPRGNLARQLDWWFGGRLLGPARTFGAAVIITAGPWLVAVMALGIVSVSMQPVLGESALEDLHLTVVYAFCVAPLVAGPIGTIAARLVRAALEDGSPRLVPAIFIVAAIFAGGLTQLIAVLVCLALGIASIEISVAFVHLAVAAAFLWISFAILSAMRSYGFLIAAFCAGMTLSVVLCMLTVQTRPSTELLVWSFTAGMMACVALSLAHTGRECGRSAGDLLPAARLILDDCWRKWHLCLGVFLAFSGVWMDKWFFWLGPEASRSAAGFLHFSPYDSVMFMAQLSIVPTFATMFIFHGSGIDQAIAAFRRSLRDRSTHAVIRGSVDRLGAVVWTGVFRIVFVQATITTALVFVSPLLAGIMNFNFSQFLLLQVALISVFLQSIFYLTSSILMLCNRHRVFLLIHLLFLVANVVISFVFYAIFGVSAYAVFTSSLIAATLSFLYAYKALSQYDFLTFLDENDSLYPDSRITPSEWLTSRLSAARAD